MAKSWPGRASLMLATAGVAAVALAAYTRHEPLPPGPAVSQFGAPVQTGEVWAGQLAAAPAADMFPAEPLSSASLVVPKSQLALPATPPKPKPRVKAACDSADTSCVPHPVTNAMAAVLAPAATPPRKLAPSTDKVPVAGVLPLRPPGLIPEPAAAGAQPAKAAANGRSPILASIGRPFAAIGHTVKSWFNWL